MCKSLEENLLAYMQLFKKLFQRKINTPCISDFCISEYLSQVHQHYNYCNNGFVFCTMVITLMSFFNLGVSTDDFVTHFCIAAFHFSCSHTADHLDPISGLLRPSPLARLTAALLPLEWHPELLFFF